MDNRDHFLGTLGLIVPSYKSAERYISFVEHIVYKAHFQYLFHLINRCFKCLCLRFSGTPGGHRGFYLNFL